MLCRYQHLDTGSPVQATPAASPCSSAPAPCALSPASPETVPALEVEVEVVGEAEAEAEVEGSGRVCGDDPS